MTREGVLRRPPLVRAQRARERYFTWILLVAPLVVTAPLPASAGCASLPLRTFSAEERQQFETQYGVSWWKAMGLIPGPQSAADYVERPFGDSLVTVFMPQQFWDPGACVTSTDQVTRPRPAASPKTPRLP